MRILFIAPYPPSRIRTRSYGFLSELKREHEVTVLAQAWSQQELADAEALRCQGLEVITVCESRLRAATRSSNALLSTTLPLQVAYARSQRFLQEAQRLCIERHFDIAHVEHLRGIASIEPLAQTHPLVWDAVDCISLLAQQAAIAGPSMAVRTIASLDYERTQLYEASLLAQHIHTITASERDRQVFLDLYRSHITHLPDDEQDEGMYSHVIPCGVDLAYFHPRPRQQRLPAHIVFFGKMSYHANIAAALYLCQQIMPLIWQHRPEATLAILGDNPPPSLRRLAKDARIEVTGYVEDLRPLIRRAQVMLSPMVYSVGIQNKVLEAMALGTPTVVAAQSAAAMHARHGRDLLVAESAQDFANYTLRLLQDVVLHARISRCGRSYVERYHDWSAITKRLVNVYQRVIATYAYRNASLGNLNALPPGIPTGKEHYQVELS